MTNEMPQPKPLPQDILDAIEAHNNKNITAGNMGDGSVYGIAPYDLVGQKYPNALEAINAQDEEDDEDER